MKKLTLLSLLLLLAVAGYSQNSFYNNSYEARNSGSFNQEIGLLSFGIGFPNKIINNSYNGSDDESGFGPLYVKYEHGFLRDEVGLGGVFSNSFGSYDLGGGEKYKIHAWSLGALGYYHFNKLIPLSELDVYAGAGLMLQSYTGKDTLTDSKNSDTDLNFVIQIGARYYFSDTFGAYLEFGFDDMSDVNLGVTLRF